MQRKTTTAVAAQAEAAATTVVAVNRMNIDELCMQFVYEGEKIPQFSFDFFQCSLSLFPFECETKAIKSAKKKTVIGDINECSFTQQNYGGVV